VLSDGLTTRFAKSTALSGGAKSAEKRLGLAASVANLCH
jgi:hypothetical protein